MLELLERPRHRHEDGVMCDSESQKHASWQIREGIIMAASSFGTTFKHDISLATKDFEEITNLAAVDECPKYGGTV